MHITSLIGHGVGPAGEVVEAVAYLGLGLFVGLYLGAKTKLAQLVNKL